jgi:hypothetical protein
VLSLLPGYARLDVSHDEDFAEVSHSMGALLQACRLNGLGGALVVSRQDAYDWRSSLRIGLAANRADVDGLRLALVADHFNDGARDDVLAAARTAGLDCRVFRDEAAAIAWIAA